MKTRTTPVFSHEEVATRLREVGRRITWARELAGMTQEALGKTVGVEISTINKIEKGTRCPSVVLLYAICDRLSVSFDYIMAGTLNGVDGALALRLVEKHPELRQSHTQSLGTSHTDKRKTSHSRGEEEAVSL
jgi:DNA-binding XRE family transcriptional regulator